MLSRYGAPSASAPATPPRRPTTAPVNRRSGAAPVYPGSPHGTQNVYRSPQPHQQQHQHHQQQYSYASIPRTPERVPVPNQPLARTPTAGNTSASPQRQISSSSSSTTTTTTTASAPQSPAASTTSAIVLKCGMLGDAQVGKTSMMVKYVEGAFAEDYVQTLGVNFMEKRIRLRNNDITFSVWDLGGQKEFSSMLPLVCNDATALLFMFDLTRKSTLASVREWFVRARQFNRTAIPFLVGTKFDQFAASVSPVEQAETTALARHYAQAMHAPLVYTSSSHGVNVEKIFKIVLSKAFRLRCTIPVVTGEVHGEPICEY